MFTRKQFIDKYSTVAANVTKNTGIFPETLLAMAIVESQGKKNNVWYVGAGLVATKANNYFGIKDSSSWNGETIKLPTPGDKDKISTFRKYDLIEDSFKDFVKFLKINPRYKKNGVFNSKDYPEQIINIARAGYAENMQYAVVITSVANSVAKAIKNQIIKPLQNNKGIAGALLAFFFLLLYNKKLK
jgi:flagellum-specific peptidoglycan hydrolase FlgJ